MQENENKTIFSETQTDNNSVADFYDSKIVEKPKTTKEKITSASKTKSASDTKKTTTSKTKSKSATDATKTKNATSKKSTTTSKKAGTKSSTRTKKSTSTKKTSSVKTESENKVLTEIADNESITIQTLESEQTQISKNNEETNYLPENKQTENVSENKNIQKENVSSETEENKTSETIDKSDSLPNIEINSNVSVPHKEKTSIVKTIEIITGSTVFRYVLGAMIIFAMCFITSLFTFNIVLVPVEVQGYSMLPTINASASGDGGETYTDIVYVSKSKNIHYKDIVVIKGGKTPSGKQIIKRVIATPGDTLTFKKVDTTYEYGQIYFVVDIYLNGNKLNETYTKEAQTKIQNTYEPSEYYEFYNELVAGLKNTNTTETITAGEFTITMGKDEYFVMGDNRNSYNIADERSHGSIDSRMFGTVKKDEIVGKVAIQVKYGKNMLESIWTAIFGTRLQNA